MVGTFVQLYVVQVHTAEEGGYWGEVIDLPGCVSQGETLEELSSNLKEAIEAVLQRPASETQLQLRIAGPPESPFSRFDSRGATRLTSGTA